MQIVHNVTQVITEFILVDDEGNVIDRKRGQSETGILSKDEFDKMYEQLVKFKDNWSDEVCQPDSE